MAARTPKVKLFLKLQEGSSTVQVGYEEVEIDGFRYKRRKPSVAPASPTIDENRTPNASALVLPPAKPSQVPVTPLPSSLSLASQLAVKRYLREHLALLPEDAAASEVLTAIAASVGEAVLDGCGDEATAAALQTVLQDFLIKLRLEASGSGAPRCAFGSSESATDAPDLEATAAELEARKRALRARLERCQQEEEEWQALLDSVRQGESVGLEAADEEGAGEAPSPSATGGEPEEVATLRALRSSVHCSLAMQVDSVGRLISDVSDLVSEATTAARAAQMTVHQERFRAFAHMDSPARLIQALARAPPPPSALGIA